MEEVAIGKRPGGRDAREKEKTTETLGREKKEKEATGRKGKKH